MTNKIFTFVYQHINKQYKGMRQKMHKKMSLKKESPVQSVQPCWFQ